MLGKSEIKRFFLHIHGSHALMAKLLYGAGLRLMACVRLRIKDVDFDRKRIHIRGKGDRWRSTILPDPVVTELESHIEKVKDLQRRDLQELMGHADVKTTERYTHVMDKDIRHLKSPLDDMGI